MNITKLSLLLAAVVAGFSVASVEAQTSRKAVQKPAQSTDALIFDLGLISGKPSDVRSLSTTFSGESVSGINIGLGASQQVYKIDADQSVDLGAVLNIAMPKITKASQEFSTTEIGLRLPVTYRYKLDDFGLIAGAYIGYNFSQSAKFKASAGGVSGEVSGDVNENQFYYGLTVGGTYQVSDYRFKLAYNLTLGNVSAYKEVGAITVGVDYTGLTFPKLF